MTPYEQLAEKIAVALEQWLMLREHMTRPPVIEVIARILTESASGEGDARRVLTEMLRLRDRRPTYLDVVAFEKYQGAMEALWIEARRALATTEQANRPEPDNG